MRRMRMLLVCCLFALACGDVVLPDDTTPALREFVLRAPPPEDAGAELFAQPHLSHREVLERIGKVATDAHAKGLFLQLGSFGGGWARAAELRRALAEVRAAQKPVHCYFEETDNAGYAVLASSCDRITMTPTGMLGLTGVHLQLVHAKELLDLIGVRADLMQVGKFKGAAEGLTQTTPSDEIKQTLGAVLDAAQGDLAQTITAGRKLDAATLTAAFAAGPQTASTALRLRLVDAVAFDDEARAHAKTAAKADRVTKVPMGPSDHGGGFFELLKMLFGEENEDPHGKRIALAYVSGTIGNGDEDDGSGVHAGPFVAAMRKLADEEDVAAVVLRIDSPGGSALASDRMWHAVRRVAKRKPVVVSIGDMAASGGYYIACAGTEIFAEDTSLVGSIGVVGGKIVLQDLATRAGVRVTDLSRGPNAAWASPMQAFSDGERAVIRQALEETYRTFVARVAEGRKRTPEQLSAVVEGRLMTGARAREGGLVDQSGGLQMAIDRARKLAGVAADAPLELWPGHRNLFDRLSHALPGADAQALARRGVLATLAPLGSTALPQALLSGERAPLAVLPYALSLR
jgi:protease IV